MRPFLRPPRFYVIVCLAEAEIVKITQVHLGQTMATAFVRVVGLAALLTSRFSVVVVGTTIDTSTECTEDLASCTADSSCLECASELSALFEISTGDSTTEYSECLVSNVDETSTATTCEAFGAVECCFSSDCFENEVFSSYWKCVVEMVGCSTEDFSCDDTSTAAATVPVGTVRLSHLVCAIVLVFTLVRMGF